MQNNFFIQIILHMCRLISRFSMPSLTPPDLAIHSITKPVYQTPLCKMFRYPPHRSTSLRLRPSFTEHMLLAYPVEAERIAAAVVVIQAVADT